MRFKPNWSLGLFFLLPILCIGLISSLPTQPIACVTSDRESTFYKANPKKIVIEPWRGEHNVYALFAVPQEYAAILKQKEAIVKVHGITNRINATKAKASLYQQVEVSEGNVLLVAYLWTRAALWQILQGKYSELQHPCSWTLYIRL